MSRDERNRWAWGGAAHPPDCHRGRRRDPPPRRRPPLRATPTAVRQGNAGPADQVGSPPHHVTLGGIDMAVALRLDFPSTRVGRLRRHLQGAELPGRVAG